MTTGVPNPFVYGSPDSGAGRRRGGGQGASAQLERVAKAPLDWRKIILVDAAITTYFVLVAVAVVASSSEDDSPTPAEAWAIAGFTVLVLLGLAAGFGHFLTQWQGLLGVLYARASGTAWEVGPRWGFVLRHRATIARGDTLVVVVDELPPARRGGRNYGKYLWTVGPGSGDIRFRSPVGLSSSVRDQITAWAQARAVPVFFGGVPQD